MLQRTARQLERDGAREKKTEVPDGNGQCANAGPALPIVTATEGKGGGRGPRPPPRVGACTQT